MHRIDDEWAWLRLEAMADGALDGRDLERMRKALDEDAALREALDRARGVRQSLRDMRPARPPRGLLRRLLVVPSGRTRAQSWFLAPAGALSVAAVAAIFALSLPERAADREAAALRDFALAMTYLQEAALVAQNRVGQSVTLGLVEALNVSRGTLSGSEPSDQENGD
jgi:hypothetical protein